MDVNMASLLLATAAVLVAIVGSTLTIVTLMFRQSNRHEDSIKALDAKFAKEFKRVHGDFTGVHGDFTGVHGDFTGVRRDIFGVAERLARVEGHLTAPQGFARTAPSRRKLTTPPSTTPLTRRRASARLADTARAA